MNAAFGVDLIEVQFDALRVVHPFSAIGPLSTTDWPRVMLEGQRQSRRWPT